MAIFTSVLLLSIFFIFFYFYISIKLWSSLECEIQKYIQKLHFYSIFNDEAIILHGKMEINWYQTGMTYLCKRNGKQGSENLFYFWTKLYEI